MRMRMNDDDDDQPRDCWAYFQTNPFPAGWCWNLAGAVQQGLWRVQLHSCLDRKQRHLMWHHFGWCFTSTWGVYNININIYIYTYAYTYYIYILYIHIIYYVHTHINKYIYIYRYGYVGIVIIHDLGILFEFVAKGSFPGSWPWLVKTESGWGNLKELGRGLGVGFAWHRRWKDVDFLRVFHVKITLSSSKMSMVTKKAW